MTEAEQAAAEEELIRFQQENPHYWGDQDENGVDLARLRENLKLTPAERLDQHEGARQFAYQLKEAGAKFRAAQRSRPSVSSSRD